MVKVTRLDEPEKKKDGRLGFMKGKILVPDDFDTMGSEEIARMFEGEN